MTAEMDLKTLLRGSLDGTEANPRPHPAKERLLAVVDGNLEGDEAEELRDHLAACRRCQAIVRLERFAGGEPADAADAASRSEAAAGLDGVLARIGAPTAAPLAARRRPERRGRWLAWAACLGLATLGALWIGQLQRAEELTRQLAAALRPANVAVHSLPPRGFQVRAGDPGHFGDGAISCPPAGVDLVWILATGRPAAIGQVFQVTLLSQGNELWRGEATGSALGTVDLRLPPSLLRPGTLTVRLEAAATEPLFFDARYDCPNK